MAVRKETVILSLDDQFSTGAARAAAATALLNRSLHDLDGTSVDAGTGLRSVGSDADGLTPRLNRSGDSINQLTGRLRLLTDAALTIGPALVPLGGAAVVGIAGLAAQFGALAGGVGVAIAALDGVGDALEAVNKYQLEPSYDNLAKVAEEFNRIGPAAAEFVVYLESISPQLREMQMIAREGALPGLAEGIDSFLKRGPQLNNIIGELATSLGNLSESAGLALGGPRFDAFFAYLESDAGPLLEEFARSLGYVAEGFANLLVAFAPASDDFSSGLEGMTRAFAEWSRGLQDNDSFQEFLAYIRSNGPAAIDFLGSFVQALASVVEAAAPVGQAVLPALTALLDIFAGIAGNPVGTALLTAAAGFVAFNRAASIVSPIVSRLGDALFLTDRAFTQAGTSATSAGGKISTALKFGGLIAGIALVNEAVNNLGETLETANISRNLEAFARGADVANFDDIGMHIEVMASAMRTAEEPILELTSGFGLLGDTARDKASKEIETLDQALASLVEGGNPEQAADAFERLIAAAVDRGVDADEARKQFDAYATALDNAGSAAEDAGAAHVATGEDLNYATTSLDAMRNALQSAREEWKAQRQAARSVAETFFNLGDSLNDSEVSLRGWLAEMEKNARALQEFQQNAQRAARRGLDEGLVKSLQNAGSEGALRMRQLANATDAEIERANRAWYKGQGAVKDFVKEVGGVKPKYVTRLEAQIDQAMAEIQRLKAALDIPDETVNVWITRRTVNIGNPSGMGPQIPSAEGNILHFAGGDVRNAHQPELYRGGVTRVWGEPETGGEAYIPLRNDHRRPRAKAIAAETVRLLGGVARFADGGVNADWGPQGRSSSDRKWWRGIDPNNPLFGIQRDFISAADLGIRISNLTVKQIGAVGQDMERLGKGPLSKLSKAFEKASDLAEKELEASKRRLEALRSERDSIAEMVASRLRTADLFGQQTAGNTNFVELERPENWAEMSAEQQAAFLNAQWSVNQSLGYGQPQAISPVDILRADMERAREEREMIRRLKRRGLSGDALRYAIETDGGLAGALDLSKRELRQFERLYDRRDRLTENVGQMAGNAVLGQEIRAMAREVRRDREIAQAIRTEARDTNRRLERLERLAEKNPKETGAEVGKAVNEAASDGQRRRRGE